MPDQSDNLSAIFGALADPTRRAILGRLAQGEATVTELSAPFDLSLPAISKHLRVLQRARLIEQGRQAQWRPCRLKAEPLQEVADWLGRYREFLGARYERLDAYLRGLQETGGRPGIRDPHDTKEQDDDRQATG